MPESLSKISRMQGQGSHHFAVTPSVHVASVDTRWREQMTVDIVYYPATPQLQFFANDFLAKCVLPVSITGTSAWS